MGFGKFLAEQLAERAARDFENWGDYKAAAEAALSAGGTTRERHARAARILFRGKLYDDAIQHFKEALGSPAPYHWCDVETDLTRCYEAAGDYNSAFDLRFRQWPGHWDMLWDHYRRYRAKASFSPAEHMMRELLVGLCGGQSRGHWRFLREDDRKAILDEMDRLGLHREAIAALNRDSDVRCGETLGWQAQRLATLHVRIGDVEGAARVYERYCAIPQAVDCYRRLESTDKVILSLLADGKAVEAKPLVAMLQEVNPDHWLLSPPTFSLTTFDHPLRRIDGISSEQRLEIFFAVDDQFEAVREQIFLGWDVAAELNAWSNDIVDGRSIDTNVNRHWRYLPVELAALYALAGDPVHAALILDAAKELSRRTAYPRGRRWWSRDFQLLREYLLSGEFHKALFVGDMALRAEAADDRTARDDTFRDMSKSFELLGAFREALAIHRERLACADSNLDVRRCHEALARLTLKQGEFADAGRELFESLDRETPLGLWQQGAVVAARLCAVGKDDARRRDILKIAADAGRKARDLAGLAACLERHSFYEEAIGVYHELRARSSTR